MRVPTAAGLRLSQPTRWAPSGIGLTSRGGTGMRVPHRSWTSSSFSASPEGSLMYRAYLAGKSVFLGKANFYAPGIN